MITEVILNFRKNLFSSKAFKNTFYSRNTNQEIKNNFHIIYSILKYYSIMKYLIESNDCVFSFSVFRQGNLFQCITFILPVFCLIKSLIIETHSIQISTIHHSKTVSQHVLGVRNWRILFCFSTLSPFCCIFQTKQNFI